VNIPIVYEDDWLLAVDKPSGLLTIPTPKKEQRTLTSILNEHLKSINAAYRLHPCHRLDRDTSGLILYAKGKSVQKKMMELFRSRKIKKTYTAFIKDHLNRMSGVIKSPVQGIAAITEYRVIGERKGFTIVEVMPLTGRTNQIRIHFSSIGHPILGERKFAFRRDFKIKAKRLCLHAQELEFIHPFSGRQTKISCGLERDLEEFLKEKE